MRTELAPERDDVLLSGVAPKHIRKFLRDAGGVTPFNENRYRLVIAEKVMIYVGAKWNDWSDATALLDQGGLEFEGKRKSRYVTRDPTDHSKTITIEADVPRTVGIKRNQPKRVIEEMRMIPRYTDIKGWLLQAWFPSSYYSPEHYEITVKGRADLPLLGEFPKRGQYERQFFHLENVDGQFVPAEIFQHMPSQSWMQTAIEHNEKTIEARKTNGSAETDKTAVQWRTMIAMQELMKARTAYEKSQRSEFDARIKDSISPIFSNTLEGGRIREELAQRCRAKGINLGHVGN